MINALIRWSLANRLAVLIISIALLFAGSAVTVTMPVDVLPDLTAPTVTLLVEARGMAPEEIETLVTFPIETAVNGAADVRRVRSSTTVGFATIWVEFDWGTDIFRARQTVAERLATIADRLPEQVDPPIMAPMASLMGEILFISLTSDRHGPLELRTLASTNIRRRILSVPGVAQVALVGGDEKQYQVVLSPQRLRAYGISIAEVADAVREANENVAAGFLVEGGQEAIIQGVGRVRTTDDIAGTVVVVRKAKPIKVSDLGTVIIGSAIKRGEAAASRRGPNWKPITERGVVMAILKQPGINTIAVTAELDGAIDEIQTSLPEGMVINKNLFRQATFIGASVHNTVTALRDGGIMVILIVIVFLASFRASFISLLAIPVSLVTTVLTLRVFGASINTMTLGGMAIAIGAVVDDAIIDVENIIRRLRQSRELPESQRPNTLAVIFDASVEVRTSIVFATFIIMLVFAPIFFLSGVEGRLLRPLGLSFVVSLCVSLIAALTLTPALSAYLLPRSRTVVVPREPRIVRALKRLYAWPLGHVMRHPWRMVVSTVVLLIASIVGAVSLGSSFLPEFSESALVVGLVTVPGTSLEESDGLAHLVEKTLMKHPEIAAIGRRTGRGEADAHGMNPEGSEIDLTLDMDAPVRLGKPRRTRAELLEALRADVATIPGVQATFGQPIGHRIDHMLSGTRANIAVKIFGEDLLELRELAKRVESLMGAIPGAVDVSTQQQNNVPIQRIEFDRQAMARHGLHVRDVATALQTAFRGTAVSEVLEGVNAFKLVVRTGDPANPHSRLNSSPEMVAEVLVDTPSGAKIPLKALARISEERGPNMISRENAQRKIVVMCNVADRALGDVVADIRRAVADQIDLPQGYYVQYGGQFESAEATNRRLRILGVVIVLGIGFLLHVAFGSLRDAMLVMVNLPFALIGGVAGVFLSGGVLSVASVIGFISVFGIAARNGIMMVSHIRHLQQFEGVTEFHEAVRRGAMERLAPILMTALSAGLALIPLVLGGEQAGREILTPMAVVILCGLLSSTALNMMVVPALYVKFGRPAPVESSLQNQSGALRTGRAFQATTVFAVALLFLTGCAQVKPQPDFARARELIQESTGMDAAYDPDGPALTQDELDAMLSEGLSLDEAVRIALLNNRRLQGAFMDIGVARADWVQSGLFANPSLGVSMRFPEGGGRSNLEASLAQNIVDLWQIPVRRRASQRALDQTVLRIARTAGELATDTKSAYFRAVAAERLLEVARENLGLVDESFRAVEAQREAGTASALDENLARGQVLAAGLAIRNARLAMADARRRLARRLSVRRDLDGLALTDPLPAGPTEMLPGDALTELARASRLDLRALAADVESSRAKIRLAYLELLPEITIGAELERGERRAMPGRDIAADFARTSIANGAPTAPDIQSRSERRKERRQEIDLILGPSATMTLPVFDQNQAQIAKARYQHRQAVKSYERLCLDIVQDIRASLDHARTASSNLAYYRAELLPQAERNVAFAQEAYRAGQATILALLEAQRLLLATRRDYIAVWAESATALAELERAVGVPLADMMRPTPSSPSATTRPATTRPTEER